MITEDYCSYEVAKLLKEKGFDESCGQIYDGEGNLNINNCGYINEESPDEYFHSLAPTHQMAMKWLREEHNIFIVIEPHMYDYINEKNSSYVTSLWQGPDCPNCFPSNDLSCSTVDNENVYKFVRHMDKEEYKEIINRTLCN